MPIDNGHAGRERRPPDDWERIETERPRRDAIQRAYDESHDPSEDWEHAARPLPEDYGKDRPATRTVQPDQAAEMVELWGQDAFNRLLASGRITIEGAERHSSGQEIGQSPTPEHQQDRPSGQADAPAEPGDTATNAWDTVEGDKPDRDSIHVNETKRIHILDGDGLGNGGHLAGTGVPLKSEFPTSWDDEKIISVIEDLARNPDQAPVLKSNDRWEIMGTRGDVEIRVYLEKDGTVVTGYPEGGAGVIRNDEHGNPELEKAD